MKDAMLWDAMQSNFFFLSIKAQTITCIKNVFLPYAHSSLIACFASFSGMKIETININEKS
jgi:hypothetical protein